MAKLFTLDEVKQFNETPCWTEEGRIARTIINDKLTYNSENDILKEAFNLGIYRKVSKNYGRSFRCWDTLPTTEEMDEIEWELNK